MREEHVVLQVHDPLRPAGRARGVHPERHVIPARIRRRKAARRPSQPFGARQRAHRTGRGTFAIGDDNGLKLGVAASLAVEALDKGTVADRDGGAGVGEIELQEVGRSEGVDEQRHQAGAYRAEMFHRPRGWRVDGEFD